MKRILSFITILFFIATNVYGGTVRLDDEGTNKGYVARLDFVGPNTTASRSGIKGTVNILPTTSDVRINSLGVGTAASGTAGEVIANSFTAGAITGTSFIIGANTLDNEWAYLDGQDQTVATTSSPTFVDLTLSTPSNIYALSHDSFADFVAGEHFLQTAITNVSTALSTGLLKVTTGTGALSSITDNSANWDTAYTHSQDNTQAHSDYLLNNASDTTSGTLTATGGFISGGNIASDTDSTDDLGSSTVYWANAYIDRTYFNSTAYLDGGIADTVVLQGADNPYLKIHSNTGISYLDLDGGGASGASRVQFRDDGSATWRIRNVHSAGTLAIYEDTTLNADIFTFTTTGNMYGGTSFDFGTSGDTDLLQLASGVLTVNGTITSGNIGISGTNPYIYFTDTDTADAYESMYIIARDGYVSIQGYDSGGPTWTEGLQVNMDGYTKVVGDLRVDGGDIGLTADTDLMQLAANALTVNGNINLGTNNLNIGAAQFIKYYAAGNDRLRIYGDDRIQLEIADAAHATDKRVVTITETQVSIGQITGNTDLSVSGVYKVGGTQVVTNQQAHIDDPPITPTAAQLRAAIVAILDLLEAHGLMAP